MSGIAKGIKKVFKAVGKVVKKVAAPLLAVAAITFTAGAALGLAPLAGGFGGAVTGALGAIGAPTTGVIGSVLTGAVTQAGYGAAIGGVTSMATGGDFGEGATLGALGGAVTGGLSGALGAGGLGGAAGTAGNVTASGRNGLAAAAQAAPQVATAGPVAPTGASIGNAVAGPAQIAATPTMAQRLGGGLGRIFDSPVAGNLIGGVGKGLLAGMAAKEDAELYENELNRRTASYDVDASVYDTAYNDGQNRPSPEKKFGRRYEWNGSRIVYG